MDVLWADAQLQTVEFTFEVVSLVLTESTGAEVVIGCFGPIGVDLTGFWDEMVVESGEVVAAHPFAERCWSEVERRHGREPLLDTGSPDRNLGRYETLVVSLSDGCTILVAAARFQSSRSA